MPAQRVDQGLPDGRAVPPHGLSSRDRILWAAATMLREGPDAALSVRAVADRAGVSTGSLRHHFPTQRALMAEMLTMVFDLVVPQDRFRDSAIPPRDRLLGCLQGLLVPVGTDAREAWIATHERYIAREPDQAMRAEYAAMQREVESRVRLCLDVLVEEGALAAGDTGRRVRFLLTLVNGISIEQVLPGEGSRLASELDALRAGVDCVFDGPL